MDRENIIRMAREAGYGEAMSDLHAPALERLVELARAAEREACAKLCEDAPEPDGYDLAEKIRARGQG